ncbi:MAG: hypothetical protein AB7O68_02290 [Pirellulales bacterium]
MSDEQKLARAERVKAAAHLTMANMLGDRRSAQLRYLAAPAFRVDRDAAHAALMRGQKAHEQGDITDRKLEILRRDFEHATDMLSRCLDGNATINKLVDSCTEPELVARWQELRHRRTTVLRRQDAPRQALGDLQDRRRSMTNKLRILEQQTANASGEAKAHYSKELAARRRDLEALQRELEFAEEDFAKVEQERLAVDEERDELREALCEIGWEKLLPAE